MFVVCALCALMCEGMDWELTIADDQEFDVDSEEQRQQPGNPALPSSCTAAAGVLVGRECPYWESMEGPNDITQYDVGAAFSRDALVQAATTCNSNPLPMPDAHHEIVALDLLKVAKCHHSSTNSTTVSVVRSCLNFNSMQKSFPNHIESPLLSLASNDYATNNESTILLLKSQAHLADDYADAMDNCNCTGADQGRYDGMNCVAKSSSNDADAGKSSEVCAHEWGLSEDEDHSNSELSCKDPCHGMQDHQENQSNSEVSCKGGGNYDPEGGRENKDQTGGSRMLRKKGKASPLMYKRKHDGRQSQNEASEKQVDVSTEPPRAHIFTERERRKKMKCLYDTLQSLLSLPKADKATILEATISKIQMLENEKTLLLSQKASKCRKLPTNNDNLHSETNNKKEVHKEFLQSNGTNDSIHHETLAYQENFDHYYFDKRDPFGHVELHVSGSMGLFTISLHKVTSSSMHLPNVILSLLLSNNLEVLSAHISSSHDIVHYSLYTKAFKDSPTSRREIFELAYRELLCQLPT